MSEAQKEKAELTQLRSALAQHLKDSMAQKHGDAASSAPSRIPETFEIQSKAVEQALANAQELQAAQRRLLDANQSRQQSQADAFAQSDKEHKLLTEARK